MALRIDDVDLARDRALVERFQEGDQGAFDVLYKRYFARLTRYCLKRVGDPNEAEEIAQEAFTRALRALPSFEGERRFYPWMTVIAGRLCVDVHRRRGRTEPSAEIDLGVTEGGQERVIEAVDIALLGQAVDRLAPRHREVLELRERDGWSYQQIAEHYDVPMSTVEALLFRARKALKREFIAIAGGERSWVTLPLLGGGFRRLALWRAKAQAWAATLPSVAGSAVAVAAVVTGMTAAAVGGGLIGGAGHAPAASTVRTVGAAATLPAPPAGTLVGEAARVGEPATATPATLRDASPATPPSSTGDRVAAAPRAESAVADQVGFDNAHSQSNDDRLLVDVASTGFVGLDSGSVRQSVSDTAHDPSVSGAKDAVKGVLP